jgi:hypothetical protein
VKESGDAGKSLDRNSFKALLAPGEVSSKILGG